MKRCKKIVNLLFLIAGVLMIAYFVLLGVCVRFGQSLSELWLLGGLLFIGRYFLVRRLEKQKKQLPRALRWTARTLFIVLLAGFLAVQGVVLSTFSIEAPAGLDYIVVLGARVNGREPSGALRNRIDRAAEYLLENPDTRVIVSGGQGADEEISEAQCMYERLISQGIDPGRIFMEDQSADTAQNLRNSRDMILRDDATVGIVTNNFHMFRALAVARKLGYAQPAAVNVATTLFSLPHYLMREFVGVCYDFLRGNLAFA